jgi:hypothetical protein
LRTVDVEESARGALLFLQPGIEFVMTIAQLTEERFDDFVRMIHGLADYERLTGPDAAAVERLRQDAFGPAPRFEAALALDDSGAALGYAVWFETYSTFLGKPTMFLEDLFVR